MDEVDAELARLVLWALFAAASLTRPDHHAPDDGPIRLTPAGRASREAEALLAMATARFPFLAEPGGLAE